MRNLIRMGILALLLMGTPVSGSTPNTGPRPWDEGGTGVVSSDITRFAKCTVRKIEPPHRVVLYDHETRGLVTMDLDETVKLTARRKKDFDGRSRLGFKDLQVNQVVKVNYRTDTGRVLEVRVVGIAE